MWTILQLFFSLCKAFSTPPVKKPWTPWIDSDRSLQWSTMGKKIWWPMHPINFDSYVTVCPPDFRNHRHTNKKQLNQQVWQPKCNSRFNLEGPGLVFFSIIFDVYTHMAHTGPEKSLKKHHVLENSLNWKIVGYSWKVLEVSTEVFEYFWKLLE